MKHIWKNYLDMPPSWLVLFLLMTYFQAQVWNPLAFSSSAATALGWVLIGAGILLTLWAAAEFWRHKTSVVPRRLPDALIARGPYRFSRNPIYLADATVLLGFALVMGSVIGLVLVSVFMKLIEIRFIHGEERGLERQFPDDFAAFSKRTRRWF